MACTMRLNDGPHDYGQNVAKKRRQKNTTQTKLKKSVIFIQLLIFNHIQISAVVSQTGRTSC